MMTYSKMHFAFRRIYIYISIQGLINFLTTEAALTGYRTWNSSWRRHMTQRLTSYYGVSVILSLVLRKQSEWVWWNSGKFICRSWISCKIWGRWGRADNYSIKYLTGTQYYPELSHSFLIKLRKNRRNRTIRVILKACWQHIPSQDRINNVKTKTKLNQNLDPTKVCIQKNIRRWNQNFRNAF